MCKLKKNIVQIIEFEKYFFNPKIHYGFYNLECNFFKKKNGLQNLEGIFGYVFSILQYEYENTFQSIVGFVNRKKNHIRL